MILRTLSALLLSWLTTPAQAADDQSAPKPKNDAAPKSDAAKSEAPKNIVTVKKNPPSVERHEFQPWNPFNAGPKLNPGEKALTEYAYNLGVRFDIDVVDEEEKRGRWFIHLKPKNGVVRLSLNVKIWIPQWAPQKCIRHEEGHKTICERVYEYAGDIVRLYAEEIQQKAYPGEGGTKELAEQDAYKRAAKELNERYRETVFEYAKRVTEEYDRITQHGLNPIAEDAAIQEAFSKCTSMMTTELEVKQTPLDSSKNQITDSSDQVRELMKDSSGDSNKDSGSPKNGQQDTPLMTPLKPQN